MRRHSYGFTLLELTISITLLATIVVITGGAVRLSYRSVDNGEKKANELERLRASLTILNAQIESWLPLKLDRDGSKGVYFEGTPASLKLATNYSVWTGQKGYVLAEYRVAPDEKGKQALYVLERVVGGTRQQETKLLQGFTLIHFEYFVKESTDPLGKWVGEWSDPLNPPQKVRVRLILAGNEVAFIIPLRAQPSLAYTPAWLSTYSAQEVMV